MGHNICPSTHNNSIIFVPVSYGKLNTCVLLQGDLTVFLLYFDIRVCLWLTSGGIFLHKLGSRSSFKLLAYFFKNRKRIL